MSFVMGKEAAAREATIAGQHAADAANKASETRSDDMRASLALLSIAHSARELCWLARVAVAHYTQPEKK